MINTRLVKNYFLEEDRVLQLKFEDENKKIYLDVVFYSDSFLEYQKNLFSDFFSNVLILKDKYDNFYDFREYLEKEITKFNTQLNIFQEKLNLDTKIEIRWILQIIWDQDYIWVLIWETSLIIWRNNKLEAVIINEIEEDDKIDVFSEIVRGELEDNDKLISVGCNVYNYLWDEELKDIINTWEINWTLYEVLSTRIEPAQIGFIISLVYEFKIVKVEISSSKEKFNKVKQFLQNYKYPIWIWVSLFVIFLLILSVFSYIWNNQPTITTTIDWKKVKLKLDIDSIKRQIDAFSKLDNTNTQLAKQQYENIKKELSELEKANIQVLEVKELKKKLDQLYFKGFHINIVTNEDWILDSIYKFSDKDKALLSGLQQLIYTNGYLNVISKKAVALGIVSKNLKPTYQTISVANIKTCTKNLSQNGVYCALTNNDILNISKYWVSSVKNLDKSWPDNIVSINTYGVNKFYVLTTSKKYISNNSPIIRYVLNSRDTFGKATPYILSNKTDSKLLNWIFTGSTFAIDGTFLVWTKEGLAQFYRKNYFDTKFYARLVPGWEQAKISNSDFTGKVKVITSDNDKYVYLYDYSTQSLVVYLSTPYKTNTSYTFSYKLKYLFKIKFNLNSQVKDVDVIYKPSLSKRVVYILTTNGIYKTDLENFFEN